VRASILTLLLCAASAANAQVTAIKAGRLVDPDAGTIATNQVILVEGGKFTSIGPNLTIPAGAEVIDLSGMTVLWIASGPTWPRSLRKLLK
jgi:hypothetical protein